MKRFVQKCISINFFILSTFWTLVCVILFFAAAALSEELAHSVHRLWGKGFTRLMGIRVHIEGLDNIPRDRAIILAPNHASMYDLFVLASLPINFKWISKREISFIPLFGWAMKSLGCYFVRRDQSDHDIQVMKRVEEDLRKGVNILIFPEGTRTRTGELLPFKKGPFRIAQNSQVSLLPIALIGMWEVAPPGKLPDKWGHKVQVRIGRPFPIPPDAPLQELMDTFRAEIVQLLAKQA